MIKALAIPFTLFLVLFASASFAIQKPHVYYVKNNYSTPDGAVAIEGVPTNCTPSMGWVKYKTTQEFLCKNAIGNNEYFEFNVATNDNEYFTEINCYKSDFAYFITGKAATTLQNCGGAFKKGRQF